MQLLKSKKDTSTAAARASKANNNNANSTPNACDRRSPRLGQGNYTLRRDPGSGGEGGCEADAQGEPGCGGGCCCGITTTPSPRCRTAAAITKCCTTRTGYMPSIHIADYQSIESVLVPGGVEEAAGGVFG